MAGRAKSASTSVPTFDFHHHRWAKVEHGPGSRWETAVQEEALASPYWYLISVKDLMICCRCSKLILHALAFSPMSCPLCSICPFLRSTDRPTDLSPKFAPLAQLTTSDASFLRCSQDGPKRRALLFHHRPLRHFPLYTFRGVAHITSLVSVDWGRQIVHVSR